MGEIWIELRVRGSTSPRPGARSRLRPALLTEEAGRFRAAKIDPVPRRVNFAATLRLFRAFGVFLFGLTAAACSGSGRPAPTDPGAHWPMYLGNAARTPFVTETVSTEPPEVTWTATVGSGLRGSPIVTQDVIVFAGRDRYLYTLSRHDGSQYWRRKLEGPTAPPAVSGGTIYAATERTGKLRILSLDSGDDIWKEDFPSVSAPLTLSGDTLFIATDMGTLHSLDVGKQVQIWRQQFSRPAVAGPLVVDDFVLFVTTDSIYTLTRRLGLRRAAASIDEFLVGEPASDGAMVFEATEGGSIVAWTLPDLEFSWKASGFDAFIAGPVIAGTVGYAVTTTGQLIQFDPKDGSARIIARVNETFQTSPIVVANGILLGSLAGRLHFLSRDGEPLWSVKLDGTIEEPVSVYEGRIIVPIYGPVSGTFGIGSYRGRLLELR